MSKELYREILSKLLGSVNSYYITVETKYTIHHIERLAGTCHDRGRWKWIAEMKVDYWKALENPDDESNFQEAQRSYIDHGDMFPRFMFLTDSLINELIAWTTARQLEITDIKTPKI